jgi:hypothetical protein
MNLESVAVITSTVIAALAVAFASGMYHANKRPINVHQEQHNHAAPVTVTTSGDTIGPKLIGGLVVLVVVGLAAALVIQAVSTFTTAVGNELNRIGRDLERTFNSPAVPTAEPAPVAIPQVAPIQHPAPVTVPQTTPVPVEYPIEIMPEHQFQITDLLVPLLVAVLVFDAVGVAILIHRKGRKPIAAAPTQRNISAREVFGAAPDATVRQNARQYE